MSDMDQLCEMFRQFDRPFLEHIYEEQGNDIQRTIEYCLDIAGSQTTTGPLGQRSPAPARPLPSRPQLRPAVLPQPPPQQPQMQLQQAQLLLPPTIHHQQQILQQQLPLQPPPLVMPSTSTAPGSDMMLDYKAVVPPTTPATTPAATPAATNGSNTPMRQTSVPPSSALPSSSLPEHVVELRRSQITQIINFLHSHGIHEHREYFMQQPAAMNELKALLANLGLGTMNFPQLTEYFRQAGLSFSPTATSHSFLAAEFVRNLLQVTINTHEHYTFGDVLDSGQKEKFMLEGFIHMRRIVKAPQVDAALRDINRSLGMGYTREQRTLFDRLTWCPDVQSAPSILDLLYMTPALALAMSLVGPIARVQAAMIQVRHPGFGCADPADERVRAMVPPNRPLNAYVPWPNWQHQWQIDNMPNEVNGISKNQARNYTSLVTVFLTETPAPLSGGTHAWRFGVVTGNIGVYLGGHMRVQQGFLAAGGVQRFLNEHKDLNELRRIVGPLPDVTQLVVNPGDILISHYSLPTVAVPNISPQVRVMVSFRLYHASHVPGVYRPDAMDNIWLEYEGLHELQRFQARQVLNQTSLVQANGPAILAAAAALVNMPTAGNNVPGRGGAGQTKSCPSCQAVHRSDSRFCSLCGRPLL